MNNQRDKIIYKNTFINYGSKAAYYFFSILAVPLALDFLGKERFGIFQTVLTFVAWASLANLGIGNGLRNKISEFLGGKRSNEIKGIIGSAFAFAFLISAVLILFGSLFFGLVFEPNWLFNDLTISNSEIVLAFYLCFLFLCISLLFGLFSSISYGIHKSYLTTIAQVIHLALYSLILYLLLKFKVESQLVYISIIYGFALVISQLVPFIYIHKDKLLWPPSFKIMGRYNKELFNTSLGFFVLQISSVILFSSDNFIVSKLLGPNDVAEYSIANKVFFLIITIFSILLIQIWNATTDAMANNDFNWIKKTLIKLHKILIVIMIGSISIALLLNNITRLWIGESFAFSLTFRLLFALYVLIHCSNAIYVNILNGLGRLKIQTLSYLIAAALNFFLAYFFVIKLHFGIGGVLYSKIICVSFTLVLCMYDYRKYMKKLSL